VNDVEPFKPSIDWSNELTTSLLWIAGASVIAAVCLLIAFALLARYTLWGRQFTVVTGAYFTGPESRRVWLGLGALLVSVITGVRLSVLFTYQGNDLSTAVQIAVQGAATGNAAVKASGVQGFWMSLVIFTVLAVLLVTRMVVDLYITQRFMLRWRAWLTDRLTGDWLDGRAYYRSQFISDTIDNPDQRIENDIDVFTAASGMQPNSPHQTSNGTLLFGAVSSIVSVISFTSILWHLSGDLAVFGLVIPKAMFWSLFIYVGISTVVATRLGRPLIKLTFDNEKFNAAFRHSLSRLHDSADTVAFDRGEEFERVQLRQNFASIVDNYRRFVRRSMGLVGWNLSVNHIIIPVPWLMQAPRLFAGEIKFGDVTQSVMVFSSIQESLSWFRNSYDQFAGYRSSIIRLYELVTAGEQARQLPQLAVEASTSGGIELDAVDVRNPAGGQLITALDLRLEPGDTLIVTGKSGAGKTTLLRSLAQLWPFAGGTMRCPTEAGEVVFMSRLPYLPFGDLRTVLSYPRHSDQFTDEQLREALLAVALPDCVDRLSDVAEWHKEFSPGEQQRVAFARLLLAKPKAVFLDEATSALDEALEFMILSEMQRELPETVFVSITHRNAADPHHKRHLELLGGGEWRLGLAGDVVPTGSGSS